MILPAPLVAFALIIILGGLCWWLLSQFPLPQPAHKVATVVLVVVLILALVIYVLLPMLGGANVRVSEGSIGFAPMLNAAV